MIWKIINNTMITYEGLVSMRGGAVLGVALVRGETISSITCAVELNKVC